MSREFARFNVKALYAALDTERVARGLSWAQLQAELGVSAATMKRMAIGGRMELDGVMFMLQWLGRSAEEFLGPIDSSSTPVVDGAHSDC
jgi:hypothetical protein